MHACVIICCEVEQEIAWCLLGSGASLERAEREKINEFACKHGFLGQYDWIPCPKGLTRLSRDHFKYALSVTILGLIDGGLT
jgi:hypothetical protein